MVPRNVAILILVAGCAVRLPRPGEIGISVKTTTRVSVQVQPPAPVVALEGAPVVEFFGIPLEGVQDVVFVLDCSGSMADPAQGQIAQIHSTPPPPSSANAPGGTTVEPTTPPPPPPGSEPPPPPPAALRKIDVAQSELVDALSRLPPGTRMNVIFFNSDLEAFSASIVPLEEPSRAGMITFVRGTVPVGSTALVPAMRTAFLMNARRIVLLSDGLGNVGGNADALVRDAREAIRGGVRIDTIGLGVTQDTQLLGTLARESGGLYQPL